VLGAICLNADPSLGPVLQWVKTIGGSGNNQVAAAAADAKGNLYITGNTFSVDFPVTSAAQRNAGGSTLVRINTATSAAQKLYPAGLSVATSIQVDPQNPQILYATQGNAIWRSADGGDTWGSLPAVSPGVAVSFAAVDPRDSNILYAATRQQGVFKSTDGGQTWRAINSGIPPARDGTINVSQVWTDPKIPQVIFAPAATKLLRSANGGESWAVVFSSDFGIVTLALDRLSAGTLYLVTGAGISKSTDDGISFTPVSALPDRSTPNVIVADPFHAGVLYAGSYGGIYQSSDGGATWTKKASGQSLAMAADPNNPVLYANISSYGIVRSIDGFSTFTPIGPPEMTITQIAVGGPSVFTVASPSTDAFVVKLDSDGNVVYSTYFGGSARDLAMAMALGRDGSVYVAGTTASIDFPTTAGAYATVAPTSNSNIEPHSNFVFKLNPDGSLAWSTYFADLNTTVATIALDSAGNPFIAGSSNGGLPTTPGAYQTQFTRVFPCAPGSIGPCFPGPSSAFVTKFNANGAGLIYSTYVPTAAHKEVVQSAQALVVDANGNAYFAGSQNVVMLNAAGSAVPASSVQSAVNFDALALDSTGNLYATGSTGNTFAATAGAFQTAPQPATPMLPGLRVPGGGGDAFVIKWDAGLSLLAATLLGGESLETGESIAIDGSGNVIVSGVTDSKSFPTRAPFQTMFSSRSGFVAGLDSSLSHLLFSTYLGDGRPFNAAAVVPDGSGNILMAGFTLTADSLFIGGDPGASYNVANLIIANKIALPSAPAARLDTVVNFAGRQAGALAPGEAIAPIGSGFGADAQLLIDGAPVPVVSGTASNLVAVMPDGAKTSGAFQVQVSTGGTLSNPVFLPAAPTSPGIYSMDGTGYGQGYILNSDRTLNSPTNPAAPGSGITILATGAGQFSLAGPFAETTLPVSVFIDGFYANGIAAIEAPVAGIPGTVYQLGVYVPDPAKLAANNPNLLNFKLPPQVGVKMVFGAVNPLNPDNSAMISQVGLVLNVKQ